MLLLIKARVFVFLWIELLEAPIKSMNNKFENSFCRINKTGTNLSALKKTPHNKSFAIISLITLQII